MLLFSFIAYTTVILNLGMGIRVYRANRAARANRLFLAMCVTLCFWGFGYALMISASNQAAAHDWRTFSAVGWCFFYSVFLLFAVCLTQTKGWLDKPVVKAIMHVPALVFFSHIASRTPEGMVLTDWGWIYVNTNDMVWETAFIIYYSVYALAGFWLIHRWGKRASSHRERQQAKLIVRIMAAIYVVAAPFDTYLPLLGYPALPIAILLSTLFVAGIWHAITRYKLMMLDFDTAADHILQNMIDPVLLVGNNSMIREVNESFLVLTGFGRSVVIGKPITDFIAKASQDDIDQLLKSDDMTENRTEVMLLTQSPHGRFHCQMTIKIMQDEFGDKLGRIILLHDVGELKRYEALLKRANDELESKIEERTRELEIANQSLQVEIQERKVAEEQAMTMAYFDVLTSLPNRRKFYEKAKQAVNKAKFCNETIAVLFIDLDNFKTINDSFGHSHGDLILVEIAARMKKAIRTGDTLARMGGDEFLLLMEGLNKNRNLTEGVANHAEMIRQQFDSPFLINNRESFLSVSIGIAVYPEDGEDAETLLQHADIAMYGAKKKGRNQVSFCLAEMKKTVAEKNRIRSHLLHAIEKSEFELFYQPQVDIKTWKIYGLEALLRWRMNHEENVPPAQFIPIAEETDLIVPIGNWVMKQAFAHLKQWHLMGFDYLRVAVNLSARQIREPHFVDQVTACLEEAGLEPEMVELEMTESQAFNNDAQMLNVLQEIKHHRIGISIDDFGTDYSSFMNMKKVSFDRLKIAREFVAGIGKNEKDEAIVSSLIELTHRLGIKVIAEGVETQEEFNYILQADCDEIQGYYFFRPMPASQIETILRQWDSRTLNEKTS